MTIWKFEFEDTAIQKISMPKNAEILYVDSQTETLCLWALVDPKEEEEDRTLEIFGTGHVVPYGMGVSRKHIGSFQMHLGAIVLHVFERFN